MEARGTKVGMRLEGEELQASFRELTPLHPLKLCCHSPNRHLHTTLVAETAQFTPGFPGTAHLLHFIHL